MKGHRNEIQQKPPCADITDTPFVCRPPVRLLREMRAASGFALIALQNQQRELIFVKTWKLCRDSLIRKNLKNEKQKKIMADIKSYSQNERGFQNLPVFREGRPSPNRFGKNEMAEYRWKLRNIAVDSF